MTYDTSYYIAHGLLLMPVIAVSYVAGKMLLAKKPFYWRVALCLIWTPTVIAIYADYMLEVYFSGALFGRLSGSGIAHFAYMILGVSAVHIYWRRQLLRDAQVNTRQLKQNTLAWCIVMALMLSLPIYGEVTRVFFSSVPIHWGHRSPSVLRKVFL